MPDWLIFTIIAILAVFLLICLGYALKECRKRLKIYFKLSETMSYFAVMVVISMPALMLLVLILLPDAEDEKPKSTNR